MGMFCPICQTHQPQVQVFTASGNPPVSADEVVARKLGCGHTIGGAEHVAFVKACNEIDNAAYYAINEAKAKAQAAKASAWETMQSRKVA